jgi:hypothetical protein
MPLTLPHATQATLAWPLTSTEIRSIELIMRRELAGGYWPLGDLQPLLSACLVV